MSRNTRDSSYHMVQSRSLYLTLAWIGRSGCDGQTDRQTDGQNYPI